NALVIDLNPVASACSLTRPDRNPDAVQNPWGSDTTVCSSPVSSDFTLMRALAIGAPLGSKTKPPICPGSNVGMMKSFDGTAAGDVAIVPLTIPPIAPAPTPPPEP